MSQWNHSRRKHERRPAAHGHQQPLADGLLKFVDAGLAAVIFVGPHLLGGRHLLGRFAILSFCVATAIAWFVRQCLVHRPRWIGHSSFGVILIALTAVAFQLVPLPQSWIAIVAPSHSAALPLWHDDDCNTSLGCWETLSLSPEDTRLALSTLIAYGLLFVTAAQRIEHFDDVKRITSWVATSAIIVAVYGVVQYFTANGKFFWLYDHPYVDTTVGFKAAFTNKNHYAHFLVLGLANLLAWITLKRVDKSWYQPPSRYWIAAPGRASGSAAQYTKLAMGAALVLVVFGILSSLSRGGIMAGCSAAAVFALVAGREKLLSLGHFYAIATLILVTVAALSLSGNYELVAQRLESFTTHSVDDIDTGGARRAIWAANIDAFRESPWTGWGAGAHRFVYPLFIREPAATEFTHAENGYLQIASEAGVPGLVLLLVAVGACASWCNRTLRSSTTTQAMRIVMGGIASALVASLVHSIVDFVWFIPACMTTTILLAACALRLSQLATPSITGSRVLAPTWLAGFNRALAVGLAGVWALAASWPAAVTSLRWDAYVRADRAIQFPIESKETATASRLAELVEAESLNREALLTNLIDVAQGWPASARAHVRLAGALLSRFEESVRQSDNPMTISQIREAAEASDFQSPAELNEWLARAFGADSKLLYLAQREARRGLALCPLQGEAYLYLAELAFLDAQGHPTFNDYADQGLRVRPHDASLLFSLGKNHFVDGQVEQALDAWSRAYEVTGAHQLHILEILAGRVAAADFLQIFSPDWRTLGLLWSKFREVGTLEDQQAIVAYAARQARTEVTQMYPPRAGRVWLGLAEMQLQIDQPQEALKSLEHSYAAFPESVAMRRQLGKCLLQFEQHDAAESHLRWCVEQLPENPVLRRELLQATRAKMEHLARTTQTQVR